MSEKNTSRISKLMSQRGICSRREAEQLIEKGMVFVDGQRMQSLSEKFPNDIVIELSVTGKKFLNKKKTIIVNKPIGYVCHSDEAKHKNILKLICAKNLMPKTTGVHDYKELLKGLAPAGRLDIDSKGLVVLTQDGKIAKQIIGEGANISKEYLVRVKGQIADRGLELLNHGLKLEGEPLKPAQVSWINKDQLKFVLIEGKKRQIRKMCEAVNLEVTGLKRVRIGRVTLGNLKEGYWRLLEPSEKF